MKNFKYDSLLILQYIFGFLVLTRYFEALNIIKESWVPFFLMPRIALRWMFMLTFYSSTLLEFIRVLMDIVPTILFLLIVIIRARKFNLKVNLLRIIAAFLFVIFSYAAVHYASVYADQQTMNRRLSQQLSVENIKNNSKDFLAIDFSLSDLPRTTTKEAVLSLAAKATSALPEGTYVLKVSNNVSSPTPILEQVVEVSRNRPYLKVDEDDLENIGSTSREPSLFWEDEQIKIQFLYDNSGPAEDVSEFTIELVYQEDGIYNGEIFYVRTFPIVN